MVARGIGTLAVLCRLPAPGTVLTRVPGRTDLAEGFGIFDDSVASLQQAVDDATDEAWRILLERGLEGADTAMTRVRELLDAEIERVREQDALDSLETTTDDRSVYARIADVESRASSSRDVSDDLLAANRAAGNLRFERDRQPE